MTPKDAIRQIQDWLLSEGRCTACGEVLSERVVKDDEKFVVTCTCSRKYEYVPESGYRKSLAIS